ncbi:MAG: hypothetical protein FIB01_02975, partial [Gemmatimonadetes bacterium]|nr:hypothetical protein [Gemmatimonadota bacterium]
MAGSWVTTRPERGCPVAEAKTSSVEARIAALEQRVTELEARARVTPVPPPPPA